MPAVVEPPKQDAALELAALREINYDWTMHLRSVWADAAYDSSEIHTRLRDEFQRRLDSLKVDKSANSPLGWLLVGSAGCGKTHFLSVCRQQAAARGISFVLVDMTDVRDFWSTVLQGYLDSLQVEYIPGQFQQRTLLEKFLKLIDYDVTAERALGRFAEFSQQQHAQQVTAVVTAIRKIHPREAAMYQDVIRAILATTSHDPSVSAAGLSWINANPVDDEMRKLLGFTKNQEEPIRIVKALSWMMSLCGSTVVAFDQLDPIVAQLDPAAQAGGIESTPEGLRALSIIQEISKGLSAMFDQTYRTLTVVSCIESTLAALRKYSIQSWQDRFEDARLLPSLNNAEVAASLLFPRTTAGCRSMGFNPPYPTWPVSPRALRNISGVSPRELLKTCERHKRRCLASETVTELLSLTDEGEAVSLPVGVHPELDQLFTRFYETAPVQTILEESTADERMAPMLISACRCLLKEIDWPRGLDAVVDEFPGGKNTKSLHARIRVINHDENDREQHFSMRALQRTNANAFQGRVKGAIDGSGIDQKLPFRHCVLLRTTPPPGGKITQELVERYNRSGGEWCAPQAEHIRTLHALHMLQSEGPIGLDEWLRGQRHASRLPWLQAVLKCLGEIRDSAPVEDETTESVVHNFSRTPATPSPLNTPDTSEAEPTAQVDQGGKIQVELEGEAPVSRVGALPDQIPIGTRQVGKHTEQVTLPLSLLEKHTVVLAGAGSGKTSLLKRIIEEAALAGIPSIVIDGANDLAALGDHWPEPHPGWMEGDAQKAKAFHETTDIVYWTPGRESGNSLVLEPLPDLAGAASDSEALRQAIDAAVDGLASLVINGKGGTNENKRGLLSRALRYFAHNGAGDLHDFIALLSDLPEEAGLGMARESKFAKEMADLLLARIETNPMLRGIGTGLDPAILFGDVRKLKAGPRISIISLMGLASPELKQQFVYQLGMTLFTWIKKNPTPPHRALRGLLVVDEARDFIPSQKSIPSKVSLQLLASQARKYHLGLIFATQNPKEIENRIIGNCATHFYGRASSPTSIKTIQEQLQERGGRGDDIATLEAGQFYVYNSEAGLPRPVKVRMPMSLTKHGSALEEDEILRRAAQSRLRLASAQ
ncbi:ATP-binding protein [Schlesneria sp. T3-172]|uniref:ATP-binding protein n=1 Tax=Schlesneria sphaerica TaxID=3373610 RepID=UPI0037C5EE75